MHAGTRGGGESFVGRRLTFAPHLGLVVPSHLQEPGRRGAARATLTRVRVAARATVSGVVPVARATVAGVTVASRAAVGGATAPVGARTRRCVLGTAALVWVDAQLTIAKRLQRSRTPRVVRWSLKTSPFKHYSIARCGPRTCTISPLGGASTPTCPRALRQDRMRDSESAAHWSRRRSPWPPFVRAARNGAVR
jgi:hypothetical protein